MIFLFLFLVLLLNFIFKPAPGVLMCGLFGGGFNRPLDEAIISKIKTLGFMNQARGEHSCGYFNGEEIFKGIDAEKKFVDLVRKEGIKMPENPDLNKVFIGHTRQATYGSHSKDNAHPFDINKRLVVAHNGSIPNWTELCNKYKINHTTIFVDSIGLGMLLDKVGYGILSEYKGAAALLIHKAAEPNTLYIYHGASREEENGVEFEERPLFYLKTEEGVYVSSLEYSLEYIRSSKDEQVKTVPHNRILRIKDGKIQATKIIIERGNVNVKKTSYSGYEEKPTIGVQQGLPYKKDSGYDHAAAIHSLMKKFPQIEVLNGAKKNNPARSGGSSLGFQSPGMVTDVLGLDVNLETYPPESCGDIPKEGKLYYRAGRYWVIGASKFSLANGVISMLKKTGRIIPIEEAGTYKTERVETLYFYKGVLLKSQNAYNTVSSCMNDLNAEAPNYLKVKLSSETMNFALAISQYAKHPVTLLNSESRAIAEGRNLWYLDMKPFSSSITPKFSSRDYHFKDGRLIRIKGQDNMPIMFKDPKDLEKEAPKPSTYVLTAIPKTKPSGVESFQGDSPRDGSYDGITTKEVAEAAIKLKKIYSSIDEAMNELGDVGLCAMSLYVEDLATDIMRMPPVDETEKEKLVRVILKEAVEEKKTIESLMDINLPDIDQYILDALAFVKEDSSKEVDETLEEEEEDNEDGVIAKKVTDQTGGKGRKEGIVINIKDGKEEKKVSLLEDVNFQKLNTSKKEDIEVIESVEVMDFHDPDDDVEEEVNKVQKGTEENEEAINLLDEIVDIISDLYKRSGDLQLLNYSELAQDTAHELTRGLDNIVDVLETKCSEAKKTVPSITALCKRFKSISGVY